MGRPLKDIVEAAAAGDSKAVRELVETTQSRTYKFCFVLCGDPIKAEDIAQEAYVKALGSLAKLKQPGAFIDWLFRIARNLYIDEVRKRKEEALSPEDAEAAEAGGPELVQVLAVHRALSQFEPEDRLLLVLIDMEDYSYKDAAEFLGITEDAVRSRLFRLRKAFVEKYDRGETK